MSYEKIRNVKLDKKKNIIEVDYADNNIYPLIWRKSQYCNSDNEKYQKLSFEDKLLLLFNDFENGNFSISVINNNTSNVMYALLKARAVMKEMGLNSFDVYMSYSDNESLQKMKEFYGIAFNEFIKALYEENKSECILYNGLYYIGKLGNYNERNGGYTKYYYGYNKDRALKMSYKKAYIVKNNFEKASFEIQKV